MEKREIFFPVVFIMNVFIWMILSFKGESILPLWFEIIAKFIVFILISQYIWRGRK